MKRGILTTGGGKRPPAPSGVVVVTDERITDMMTVVVVVAKVNGMMRVITTQVPSVGAAVRLTAEYLQGECQIDGTTVQPLAIGTYRQGATRVYTVNVERSTKFNEMMRLTAEAAINAWY